MKNYEKKEGNSYWENYPSINFFLNSKRRQRNYEKKNVFISTLFIVQCSLVLMNCSIWTNFGIVLVDLTRESHLIFVTFFKSFFNWILFINKLFIEIFIFVRRNTCIWKTFKLLSYIFFSISDNKIGTFEYGIKKQAVQYLSGW